MPCFWLYSTNARARAFARTLDEHIGVLCGAFMRKPNKPVPVLIRGGANEMWAICDGIDLTERSAAWAAWANATNVEMRAGPISYALCKTYYKGK